MNDATKLKLKPLSPRKINSSVRLILSELQLPESNIHILKYTKPKEFAPKIENCHCNVWAMCKKRGGHVIYGWIISQDIKNDFIEAIFHSVWRHPSGKLIDITPRKDGEKKLMIVIDNNRYVEMNDIHGIPAIITYDNVRIFKGKLMSGIERINAIPPFDFIYEHGLAEIKVLDDPVTN